MSRYFIDNLRILTEAYLNNFKLKELSPGKTHYFSSTNLSDDYANGGLKPINSIVRNHELLTNKSMKIELTVASK